MNHRLVNKHTIDMLLPVFKSLGWYLNACILADFNWCFPVIGNQVLFCRMLFLEFFSPTLLVPFSSPVSPTLVQTTPSV